MMEGKELKRLFFAFEVKAPWPQDLPRGRILDPLHRHMTVAFLGHADYDKILQDLAEFPYPPFKVGFAGIFEECLFLPPRNPRVAAWHVKWLDDALPLVPYQQALVAWLLSKGFHPDARRDFLPHVTLCRSPFYPREWKKIFSPLPMMITNLHLYESTGGLQYHPIWSYPLHAPFEEFEHTADEAFLIRGESLLQVYHHAFTALAFKHPPLLDEISKADLPIEFDEISVLLNQKIALTDQKSGCPFKAVSYHGDLTEETDGTLSWEMIVDV